MRTHEQHRFPLALSLAFSIIAAAGFGVHGASARALPQNAGPASGGQGQQQSSPQNPPQAKPQPQNGQRPGPPATQPARPQPGKPSNPGKPSDRPTIQPVPGPRPNPGNPGHLPPPRPAPGRPPSVRPLPPFYFRPDDRYRIQRYYRRNFGYINRGRRPIFIIGGYIPFGDRGYFTTMPPHLLGYLPPPPPGYVIGYFDGYAVVYNPVTFQVLTFVDLLD